MPFCISDVLTRSVQSACMWITHENTVLTNVSFSVKVISGQRCIPKTKHCTGMDCRAASWHCTFPALQVKLKHCCAFFLLCVYMWRPVVYTEHSIGCQTVTECAPNLQLDLWGQKWRSGGQKAKLFARTTQISLFFNFLQNCPLIQLTILFVVSNGHNLHSNSRSFHGGYWSKTLWCLRSESSRQQLPVFLCVSSLLSVGLSKCLRR